MIIIGCDYYPEVQQIAFVDTETGELQETRLQHREQAEKRDAARAQDRQRGSGEFELAIMIAKADRRDAWVGLSSRPADD